MIKLLRANNHDLYIFPDKIIAVIEHGKDGAMCTVCTEHHEFIVLGNAESVLKRIPERNI